MSARALLAALASVTLLAGAAPAQAAEPPSVRIDNFAFSPATLSVKVGSTVTFENDDDIPHTVVANDRSFRSTALDTGDRFTVTFGKPGDFGYFCSLHPHMQGHVVVTP